MKVLFFLTFYNTVHTHTHFPPLDTVFTSHFEFGNNDHHNYPSFYLAPPVRDNARALPVQDNYNDHNRPTGVHVQTRQTYSEPSQSEPNTITYNQPKALPEEIPSNVTGYNCAFNLCDDAADYPDEYIKAILRSTNAFDSFFNATLPDIFNKNFGYENLCSSMPETRFPKVALNTKNATRYIANVDGYQQGVKVELCRETNSPCKFADYFPSSYESTCEQRYTVVPLLALDDDKNPIVDTFQLPSCCVCMYRSA